MLITSIIIIAIIIAIPVAISIDQAWDRKIMRRREERRVAKLRESYSEIPEYVKQIARENNEDVYYRWNLIKKYRR